MLALRPVADNDKHNTVFCREHTGNNIGKEMRALSPGQAMNEEHHLHIPRNSKRSPGFTAIHGAPEPLNIDPVRKNAGALGNEPVAMAVCGAEPVRSGYEDCSSQHEAEHRLCKAASPVEPRHAAIPVVGLASHDTYHEPRHQCAVVGVMGVERFPSTHALAREYHHDFGKTHDRIRETLNVKWKRKMFRPHCRALDHEEYSQVARRGFEEFVDMKKMTRGRGVVCREDINDPRSTGPYHSLGPRRTAARRSSVPRSSKNPRWKYARSRPSEASRGNRACSSMKAPEGASLKCSDSRT